MYSNVFKYISTYSIHIHICSDIITYTQMYSRKKSDIFKCIQIIKKNVFKYIQIYLNIFNIFKYVPIYSNVFKYVQRHSNIFK